MNQVNPSDGKKQPGKTAEENLVFLFLPLHRILLVGLNSKKKSKVVADGVNLMSLHYLYIHYLSYVIVFLMELSYLICKLINFQ